MKSLGIFAVLVAALILLLAATQQPQPQALTLPAGSALVGEVKGSVSIVPAQGAPTTAQRGMVLPPESAIDTGKGSLILLLADGSQVLVKSKTRVVLKSPDAGEGYSLRMLIGEILAQIKKRLGETPPFRMGTPSAVITVRGTRFSVQVNKKGKTTVEVFEGIVEVEALGEKPRAVLVQPGFETEVEPGGQPQQPQPINRLGLMGPGYGPNNSGMAQPGARPGNGESSGSQRPSGGKPEGPDD